MIFLSIFKFLVFYLFSYLFIEILLSIFFMWGVGYMVNKIVLIFVFMEVIDERVNR